MRFNEILLLITVVTGLIWFIDSMFFRPKRVMLVLPGRKIEDSEEPWWVEYSRSFFPILLIVLILRAFILEPFRIPSGSMRPTLLEGDFILVNKFDYGVRMPFLDKVIVPVGQPKRGDVVVFKHVKHGESMDMIKRVIGLPGDQIEYKDKRLSINGIPVDEEFLGEKSDHDLSNNTTWTVRQFKETLDNVKHDVFLFVDEPGPRNYPYDKVTVPPNHYFVMGDNRDNSDDSRSWGFVDEKEILGKAIGIWFSWDSSPKGLDCIKECIRWDRIGNGLSDKNQASTAENPTSSENPASKSNENPPSQSNPSSQKNQSSKENQTS